MSLRKTVFEKGTPGFATWSLYAILAGICVTFMTGEHPRLWWSGVAMAAGGAAALMLTDSSWLRKPFHAGIFGEAVVYRAPTPMSWADRIFGMDRSFAWGAATMAPGAALGSLAARMSDVALVPTFEVVAYLMGGMVACVVASGVAQVFYMMSRYVVVGFDVAIPSRRAAGSAIEVVAGSIALTYASLVCEERKGVARVHMLADRSLGLEKVREIVDEAMTTSGVRMASPVVASGIDLGTTKFRPPIEDR